MWSINSQGKYQVNILVWDREGNELVEKRFVFQTLDGARNLSEQINNLIDEAYENEKTDRW